MLLRSRLVGSLVLSAWLVGSVSPHGVGGMAREAQAADAKSLFQEALQLEKGGNYSAALGKFQEVAQLKRTPTVVFHIAFCQEKLGQLMAAVGGYRIAANDAAEDPKLAEVARTAQEALAALEKRIPSVTIKRGKGSELSKVTLDGVTMGSSTFGKPQQVDPGAHSIEATADGKKPFKEVVQLNEGESKTIEIIMKDTKVDPGPEPTGEPTGTGTATGAATEKPPVSKSVVPYVVMGAGGVSLLASGVFYLMRGSAISDLDSKCKGDICPSSAQSIQDRGKTMTLLGNVTLGLGVVGLGVGTVLLLTSKPKESAALTRPRSVDVMVNPGLGGVGASVVGRF